MEIITPKDFLSANRYLKYFGGERTARLLMKTTKLSQFNEEYTKLENYNGYDFVEKAIERLGFDFEVSDTDLNRIPKEGPFISISNHPTGGLDGLITMRMMWPVREDYKILVNFLMTKLGPLEDYFLAVNPFESYKDVKSSLSGLKEAFNHLRNGAPLGIFPAGEVATWRFDKKAVTDREWQRSVIKFIKKAGVPVLPVYFEGHNSLLFHFLGFFHPLLRTVRLPAEIFNKQGHKVRVRIGNPIPVEEQDVFSDINLYSEFLRTKTYALSVAFRNQKKESNKTAAAYSEEIVAPVPSRKIEEEIEWIKEEYLLFRIKNNFVFSVPSPNIPNTMKEIARLREITYREVGEGTNKSLDIDQYDEYYEQLFIWDDDAKKIVGGYRVGKGKDILATYGIKGFYINSLFKINPQFLPVLRETIELGRSFIVKEYQRKTISLFLLWKGILYFLLKNPEYRYLVGPVSISNAFSDFAKSMTVKYVMENHFNYELAEFIRPRKAYKVNIPKEINTKAFVKYTKGNISRFDRFIQDIEPCFRSPVLLKKYINLNAELLGFNVDPKFNNCLDGLMILDLFDVPMNTIESLSKELDDHSILERFKK